MACSSPDLQYIKTVPGILQILELLFTFIGLICVLISGISFPSGFYIFVALLSLIGTGCRFIFYLYHMMDSYNSNPKIVFAELVYCLGATILMCIAGILAFAWSLFIGALGGGAVLAFLNTAAYGADTFLRYRKRREQMDLESSGQQQQVPK